MGGGEERRPGDDVLIEIVAGGDLVDLVGPVADLDGGLAGDGGEDAGDGCVVEEQVEEEMVLFEKALGGAHGAVMALDEDADRVRWRRPRPQRMGVG